MAGEGFDGWPNYAYKSGGLWWVDVFTLLCVGGCPLNSFAILHLCFSTV